MGHDVLEHAWPQAQRVFAIDPKSPPSRTQGTGGRHQNLLQINWKRFWHAHDMPQVLVVARPRQEALDLAWEEQLLGTTLTTSRPEVIITLERLEVILLKSDAHKAQHRRMGGYGYQGILQHVDSSKCGSATWGSFLVNFWVPTSSTTDHQMDVLRTQLGTVGLTPRGFANCLKPVGVSRSRYIRKGTILPGRTIRENHLGHQCQNCPAVDPSGPAILDPDLVISTD